MRSTTVALCGLVIAGCTAAPERQAPAGARPPAEAARDTVEPSPAPATSPVEAPAAVDSAIPAEVESDRWPGFADGPRVRATFPPSAQEVLLEADELEVVAFEQGRGPMSDEREVHGAPVQASALVRDRKTRVELLTRLYQSVEEEAYAQECFNPHHWILARRGERRVEVLLCFECSQLVVYIDGKSQGFQTMSHAAAGIIGELVGSPAPRLFSGRTTEEWTIEVVHGINRREGDPEAKIDPIAVEIVAACTDWTNNSTAHLHVRIFECLGRDGAPGAASLARGLALVQPGLAVDLAQVIANLGPAAAPAVPTLVALLRDNAAPIDRRNHALRILAAIGPTATESLPIVRSFTTHPELGEAARAALAAISAPR